MKATMLVIAAPDLRVPTEENPRKYITADVPVEIEVTAYYLRRLADAELVEVPPQNPTLAAAGKAPSKTVATTE